MTKAYEYNKMCDGDRHQGICLRETGQVHIFSANSLGFLAFIGSQFVCLYCLMASPIISKNVLGTRYLIAPASSQAFDPRLIAPA